MATYSSAIRGWWGLWLAGVLGAALVPAMLRGADPADDAAPAAPAADAQAGAQQVDLFEGMRNGDLAVHFVPKDSRQARVTIENKTQKPLTVKLPEAFAGVPVLAQNGNGNGNNNNNNNRNQGMGGGMGGMGGMGMGGMMYIAPEKTEAFKVPTVCLEHGKTEPHPTVPYTIEPIESFTDRPAVQELCRMLGQGKINQRVAQAAAWHLSNDMSWQQLATKQQRRAGGGTSPYFTPAEIQAAMQLATTAIQGAQARKPAVASPAGSTAAK
ncbi:MAG: hypothetical protein ABSG86_18615 [Thermoguttaceae bacterium]